MHATEYACFLNYPNRLRRFDSVRRLPIWNSKLGTQNFRSRLRHCRRPLRPLNSKFLKPPSACHKLEIEGASGVPEKCRADG